MSRKLEGAARTEALSALEPRGWALVEGRDAIKKTFKFKSFVEAWGWMSRMWGTRTTGPCWNCYLQ